MRKIVISTGGGDAPGLNAVIFSVVNSAAKRGWEVYGSRSGYKGLLDLDELVRLTPKDVEGITPLGGTILGSTNKVVIGFVEMVVEYRFCQNRIHSQSVFCSGKTET